MSELLAIGALVATLLGLTAQAFADGSATPAAASSRVAEHPDLSGFWERRDVVGSGSFGGMLASIPQPEFVAGVAAAKSIPDLKPLGTPHGAGQAYVVTAGRCTSSINLSMTHSSPIDIVQTVDETLVIAEFVGVQHIYTDGRDHPPAGTLPPSNYGHAIGHWEGDTLVVDTVALNSGSVVHGGRFGPNTELIEHFKLVDAGHKLAVTMTWIDPTIYARPFTYELVYFRSAPDTYAQEEWCDASDPAQSQSIVPPKQDLPVPVPNHP